MVSLPVNLLTSFSNLLAPVLSFPIALFVALVPSLSFFEPLTNVLVPLYKVLIPSSILE